FLVFHVLFDTQGDPVAAALVEGVGPRVVNDRGRVAGVGPADGAAAQVHQPQDHRHEPLPAQVVYEQGVKVAQELPQVAAGEDAAAENRAGAGHDQGRADAVAHDVADGEEHAARPRLVGD